MEGESEKAFEAFRTYRDLGTSRTLRTVSELLYEARSEYGIRTVEKWSSRFDWVQRVRGYEDWREMLRREVLAEHLENQAKDHAQREAELRERALRVREMALDQSEKMLSWPMSEQRVIHEDSEDGETVVYEFRPAGWNKATALSMYRMAMADAPAEIPEEDLELDLSEMTEEELKELLRLEGKVRFKPPER